MSEYFNKCYEEAVISYEQDDVPIGAIVVLNDEIVGIGHNSRQKDNDILGHAEINAIKSAAKKLGRWNLSDCDLYVTLEPCSMCKEVIMQSKIKNVYYMLTKLPYKKEFCKTEFNEVNDNSKSMYAKLLSDFFKQKR